jgi:hypothetical protein
MDCEIDSHGALHAGRQMSQRKDIIRRLNEDLSSDREHWLKRAAFFHSEDLRYLSFLIPEGLRVLITYKIFRTFRIDGFFIQ